MEKDDLLKQIRDEVWNLKESPLYEERVRNKVFAVIGEGSHEAQIMMIGEAPGKNEAESGRPFCGAAGKFLSLMIESVGMKREDIYITNIVKDRPPGNRDPLPEEIKIYAPFLDRQIDIIKPKVIVTLGRFSMVYIMEKFGLGDQLKAISQMHGKVFDAEAKHGNIKIVPLYHPAAALYNGGMRDVLINDFKVIKQIM